LEHYLNTDGWIGKAGGYNLTDRQHAGWPITVEGDPATVMGLPMNRLVGVLAGYGITARIPS
jgi:predicted house-cleaning NTP pyrophosphatase (Maf/HAM1 superfamily)